MSVDDLHDDPYDPHDDLTDGDPHDELDDLYGALVDDPAGVAGDGAVAEQCAVDDPAVLGTPGDVSGVWHMQERDNTCAVAAQEFVLDDLTGVDHTEAELREVAQANGWWDPLGGTAAGDVGKLLAHYGIETEQQVGAGLPDLQAALANGDGVIVGVDSGEIWNPDTAPNDALTSYLGIPGQGADHAVQVVGIDYSDPAHPEVILNDSGTPDGQGERVPLDTFLGAWEDSGNLLVVAHRP